MEYRFWGWQTADCKPIEKQAFANPRELYDLLTRVWCAETCAPRMRDNWSPANMTEGQCSITAFAVQDFFGGEVYGVELPSGARHCYNVVDGVAFDLTSEQFGDELPDFDKGVPQSREEHFADQDKFERYQLLLARLAEVIAEQAPQEQPVAEEAQAEEPAQEEAPAEEEAVAPAQGEEAQEEAPQEEEEEEFFPEDENDPPALYASRVKCNKEVFKALNHKNNKRSWIAFGFGAVMLIVGGILFAIDFYWYELLIAVLGLILTLISGISLLSISSNSRKGIKANVTTVTKLYDDHVISRSYANGERLADLDLGYRELHHFRLTKQYAIIYLTKKRAVPFKVEGDVKEFRTFLKKHKVRRKKK